MRRSVTLVFFLEAAALGGVLLAPIVQVTPTAGLGVMLKGFVVIILGGSSGARTNQATMLMGASGAAEKPMLGRYQVEKELGKGAMGVVYLGKDPKIGRVVAIKTMALAREFDGDNGLNFPGLGNFKARPMGNAA